jgi:hypothetical protein
VTRVLAYFLQINLLYSNAANPGLFFRQQRRDILYGSPTIGL